MTDWSGEPITEKILQRHGKLRFQLKEELTIQRKMLNRRRILLHLMKKERGLERGRQATSCDPTPIH